MIDLSVFFDWGGVGNGRRHFRRITILGVVTLLQWTGAGANGADALRRLG